jgi:hypothetical protein
LFDEKTASSIELNADKATRKELKKTSPNESDNKKSSKQSKTKNESSQSISKPNLIA